MRGQPGPPAGKPLSLFTEEERHEMIAVAAYYHAEHRGFISGHETEDWLQAERDIDQMIMTMVRRRLTPDTLSRIGLRNALRLWRDES